MKSSLNNYKNSKNFCSALWMHLHIINDGRVFPCCMTPIENKYTLGNVKVDRIDDIMNSNLAKKMRKDMMDGNPLPESCNRCVSKEESGFGSMRIGMNDNWFDSISESIESTREDGSIENSKLLYWDFRFSNYCNLACRTCSPLFSTSWTKDFVKIYGNKTEHLKLINLDNVKDFWEDIESSIMDAKEIHFAGGEPLIMPEHWKILELLEKNNLYNTKLKYSTNATMLENKGRNIINIWKLFKNVHLSLSIDGVGDTFELTRQNGKWDIVKENLLKIHGANLDFWIHPTISPLNIFRLDEMHNELFNMGIIPNHKKPHEKNPFNPETYFISRFHINPAFFPNYYSIQCLPNKLKQKVEDKLIRYGKNMYSKYGIPISGWESLINIMYSEDLEEQYFNKFIELTKKLDLHRNQNFLKINPEYNEYF